MARIIGIDYGTKRTGIAISDPLQLIASPLKTIPTHTTVAFLKSYISKEIVEAIVLGWPLQLNGQQSKTTRLVSQFMRFLRRNIPKIPVICFDERFTSKMAHQSKIELGKKKNQKIAIDHISAAIILSSFMESTIWKKRNTLS